MVVMYAVNAIGPAARLAGRRTPRPGPARARHLGLPRVRHLRPGQPGRSGECIAHGSGGRSPCGVVESAGSLVAPGWNGRARRPSPSCRPVLFSMLAGLPPSPGPWPGHVRARRRTRAVRSRTWGPAPGLSSRFKVHAVVSLDALRVLEGGEHLLHRLQDELQPHARRGKGAPAGRPPRPGHRRARQPRRTQWRPSVCPGTGGTPPPGKTCTARGTPPACSRAGRPSPGRRRARRGSASCTGAAPARCRCRTTRRHAGPRGTRRTCRRPRAPRS